MHNERNVHDGHQNALIPEEGVEVPSYLIYFGIPPPIAAIIVSTIYPMARLALLLVLVVVVVTLKLCSVPEADRRVAANILQLSGGWRMAEASHRQAPC